MTSAGAIYGSGPTDRMRDDKEVVMATVTCYGGSLRYASDRLQRNKQVVQVAVNNLPNAIVHALDIEPSDLKDFFGMCVQKDVGFEVRRDSLSH